MKGGGYQVLTEVNGKKRFSNEGDGPNIHNESGKRCTINKVYIQVKVITI